MYKYWFCGLNFSYDLNESLQAVVQIYSQQGGSNICVCVGYPQE